MGKIKDSLNSTQTVTMSPVDIAFLSELNSTAQAMLDQMQNQLAAQFLHYIAVSRHGYKEADELRFNYDPSMTIDNLEIRNLALD